MARLLRWLAKRPGPAGGLAAAQLARIDRRLDRVEGDLRVLQHDVEAIQRDDSRPQE
jgi:hypothetical protein